MTQATPEIIEPSGIVELVDGQNKIRINPHGARILSLELQGKQILGDFIRADGKAGNSHPGTPILGAERTTCFGLPQHGPGRNSPWQIIERSNSRLVLVYQVEVEIYPKGMEVRQEFILDKDGFRLITTHVNTGENPAPVNSGEHFYWNTSEGWDGLRINGELMTDLVKSNGVISIQPDNILEIPGLPKISLKQKGLPWATLWAISKDGKFDSQYVCIEPGEGDQTYSDFFATKRALINPGQSRQTEILINLV
ncbi:hypothetical protein KKB64_04880 [Patescibacteria group bacterium]|nr:hypothetical protein [Patescibacteria group bacterium]MBU1473085.1 hypothetical protein [Patescibacteria group bacterium]MBU2459622.1 hypothetical protein [Patescibacteria group bacterium]MBU2544475.1 hypothetical protein [Patescibacteria group bacterium]